MERGMTKEEGGEEQLLESEALSYWIFFLV